MELTEPIESINQQLIDEFGIDTITGQPMFRIVWAADQLEKRMSKFTREGIEILHPILMELPKYPQNDLNWKERYILEQLVMVPAANSNELVTPLSYEPLHVFRDRYDNYLPPTFWAAKFAVDCTYAAMGKKSLAKYINPESDQETSIQMKKERVEKLVDELFGDESSLLGRTITGEAVGYTGPSLSESSQTKES